MYYQDLHVHNRPTLPYRQITGKTAKEKKQSKPKSAKSSLILQLALYFQQIACAWNDPFWFKTKIAKVCWQYFIQPCTEIQVRQTTLLQELYIALRSVADLH